MTTGTEAAAPAAGAGGSASGGPTDASGGVPLPAIHDVIPGKYRAVGVDGKLDLEASTRKLAAGYGELTKRLPQTGLLPASSAEYELAGFQPPEGVDPKAFRENPEIAGLLEEMHAKGFTDEQASWALGQALNLVNGREQLDQHECETQLRAAWPTDAEYRQNLQLAVRATQQLARAAGADAQQLMDRYGNDPTLVRMFARLGREMQEDRPVAGDGPAPMDFDAQLAAIDQKLSTLPPHAPARQELVAQKLALFEQRHGTRPR